MDRRLGRPLPYQLPNPTQASPKAPEGFNPKTICGISYPFGQLFLTLGQIPTRYSAVRRSPTFYTKFLNGSSILLRSFQVQLPAPVLYRALPPRATNTTLALKLFRGEPAISEFDWHFTANHKSSKHFAAYPGSVLHHLLQWLQPAHG